MHQNFWAPTISNSVFVLRTFRPTPQKLAETPNLSNVPFEYYEFADVFSKTKAEVLPPHYPYDLKINLEEGAQPPVSLIYSLSASEQEALKEFIEENLNTGFI